MATVIDASALVFATTGSGPPATRLLERLGEETTHAPHLIDAEMGAVLRKMVLRGDLEVDHAVGVLSTYPVLIDHRHEHLGWLAAFAWAARENLTFYDALYVALAAALDVEIVTLDRSLAAAPGLPARVRLATE